MQMVISPAKSLDFTTPAAIATASMPPLLDRSSTLVRLLSRKSPQDLSALMGISDTLAHLNVARFAQWHPDYAAPEAKQAVFAFNGDVYDGLDAASLDHPTLDWLQTRLNILSGLYGILRPLDLILPYRLEMGTRLANPAGANLYAYWGDTLTSRLNERLAADDSPVVVNLASDEYFKSVRPKKLSAPVWTPVFQDSKEGGPYKIVSFWAKRARGLMVRWIAEHRITRPEALRDFDSDGYRHCAAASDGTTLVFRREHASR